MKLEIFRTDINKTVVPAMEYVSEEKAIGQYISTLMLVGIIGFTKNPIRHNEGSNYTLAKGWTLQVRAA